MRHDPVRIAPARSQRSATMGSSPITSADERSPKPAPPSPGCAVAFVTYCVTKRRLNGSRPALTAAVRACFASRSSSRTGARSNCPPSPGCPCCDPVLHHEPSAIRPESSASFGVTHLRRRQGGARPARMRKTCRRRAMSVFPCSAARSWCPDLPRASGVAYSGTAQAPFGEPATRAVRQPAFARALRRAGFRSGSIAPSGRGLPPTVM